MPSHLPDKVDASGTIAMTPDGARVRRTVRGKVVVDVFGLGAIAERFVAEVKKSYDAAAARTRELLIACRSGTGS